MTADRRRIVLLYALAGAAAGVVWTMFFHVHPAYRQTDIRAGTLLTVMGTILGGLLGSVLAQWTSAHPKGVGGLIGSGVLLVTTLLGVAVGWMTANFPARSFEEYIELTRSYSSLGGALGTGMGLFVLAPRWSRPTAPVSGEQEPPRPISS